MLRAFLLQLTTIREKKIAFVAFCWIIPCILKFGNKKMYFNFYVLIKLTNLLFGIRWQ